MTIEEAKQKLQELTEAAKESNIDTDVPTGQAILTAIKSLEAWENVKQDLYKMATESLDPEYAQCYRIALCCVDGHLKEVDL